MGLLDLFIAASMPVLKVLLITALGSYLALDRINILGEDTRKHVNQIVFYVFNPALVSSNLAKTITYESMVKIRAIYLWSYVYNIVRVFSTKKESQTISSSNVKSLKTDSALGLGSGTKSLLSSKESLLPEYYADQILLPYRKFEVEAPFTMKQRLKSLLVKINLKSLLAPSTIGAVVGFVIGLNPQIRKLMIGTSAPLRVIQDSASLLGDGAIPVLTLIIGGNLLKGTITQLFEAGENECSVILL